MSQLPGTISQELHQALEMENISLDMNTTTPNSHLYSELGSGWEMVREFSFPLAVFGAVLSTILPVMSVGGSVLLLVIIMKFPQFRHVPSNLLLASLATSDLLIGLSVQPFHSAMSVCALTADDCHTLKDNRPRTIIDYFSSFLAHSSCLNIAAITIDRYICIKYALRYPSIVTEYRVAKAILSIWTLSTVLPGAHFISSFKLTTIRALQIIIISLVLFAIIYCYAKIFCISRRHKRQITSQLQAVSQGPIEKEFQSARTVFIVLGAVILCYTPVLLLQLLLIFNLIEHHIKILQPFAVTLFLLNSSINPFIIIIRRRKIRTFLKKLIKRNN